MSGCDSDSEPPNSHPDSNPNSDSITPALTPTPGSDSDSGSNFSHNDITYILPCISLRISFVQGKKGGGLGLKLEMKIEERFGLNGVDAS